MIKGPLQSLKDALSAAGRRADFMGRYLRARDPSQAQRFRSMAEKEAVRAIGNGLVFFGYVAVAALALGFLFNSLL